MNTYQDNSKSSPVDRKLRGQNFKSNDKNELGGEWISSDFHTTTYSNNITFHHDESHDEILFPQLKQKQHIDDVGTAEDLSMHDNVTLHKINLPVSESDKRKVCTL